MIFVTVGTHEQQFNRLVEYMDNWAEKNEEAVVIQTGYSTYSPKYCHWKDFFSYSDMKKQVSDARIIITHGGPSSFIMALQIGKTPIVVPRAKEFNEHVNNHQLYFCREFAEQQGSIIVVEGIEGLGETIKNYDQMVKEMNSEIRSNNERFCFDFEKIVETLFKSN